MMSATAPACELQRLFAQHRRQLVSFVQRYVCSLEDAEDAVQSAFVEALRGADGAPAQAKPSAWLFGLALSLARSQAALRAAERAAPLADGWPAPAGAGDPADVIALRQMTARVETLLRACAPPVRETFDVVVNGDATYEEAADYLDVTVGTVRLHMSQVGAMMLGLIGPML